MSSTIEEVIEKRQQIAAKNARAAAVRLTEGDDPSLREQVECEDALDDLLRYATMAEKLGDIARQYEPYGKRSPHDLLLDMNRAYGGEQVAKNRLAAHQRAYGAGSAFAPEMRSLSGPSTVLASAPGWITTDRPASGINNAPLLKYAQPLPLHSGVDIRLVGFSTDVTAGAQSSANTSINNADFVDTAVTLPIRTFAGSVTVSQQLLDQGQPGIDAQVLPSLADAVDAAVDFSILNGDGTNGTLTGLRNVSGASTQTWTDGSPTAAEFISNLEQLIRKVEVARGGSPVVILAPRRLSWLRETLATATAPIPATFSAPQIPGATVTLNGSISLIADHNIPETISTNQDVCVVLRSTDVLGDLYVSPNPTVFLDYNTASATMKTNVIVRKYAAFSCARLPAAVGILSGTGLAAP